MFESNDNTTKRIDVYSKYDIFEFDFDIIMNKLNYSYLLYHLSVDGLNLLIFNYYYSTLLLQNNSI